jgi:hypothetical protein
VLGAGKRLFGQTGAATPLRLMDVKPTGETLILTYEPAGKDTDALTPAAPEGRLTAPTRRA